MNKKQQKAALRKAYDEGVAPLKKARDEGMAAIDQAKEG